MNIRELSAAELHLYVEGRAGDAAKLQQLRHHVLDGVDADRESDAGGSARCGEDGRVDADDIPSRVQQRAPRVACLVMNIHLLHPISHRQY